MSQPVEVLSDRYELHRKLARGGMADVWLARDRVLDRPVAVKIMFAEFATDQLFVERFRREAKSAGNLNHPNIVGVYDWGEQGGTYYIVMEYINGQSVAEVLRAEGPLHPRRAAEIAADVAEALGFAHAEGVIHRDIKPGNIMLTSTGRAKVTDFGIARLATAPNNELTKAGSVMGTATYFSPEQAQGHTLDGRSDLYSLGAVLFEMLTGEAPFQAESPVAIAYKHVQERPRRPASIMAGLPFAAEAITLRLLTKNPANRYPDATELRDDLHRFLAGQTTRAEMALQRAQAAAPAGGTAATQVVTTTPGAVDATQVVPAQQPEEEPEPEEDRSRSKRFVFILIALLVLALLVAGGIVAALNSGPSTAEVPNVLDRPLDEAVKILEDEGFKAEPVALENNKAKANAVYATDPKAGVEAEEGSTVKVVYNPSDAQEVVPDVRGMLYDDAKAVLAAKGFTRVKPADVEGAQGEPGTVKEQLPVALSLARPSDEITLRIVPIPTVTDVPSVAGLTQEQARATLEAAGFVVASTSTEASDRIAAGKATRTDPSGSADLGSELVLFVSSGPANVEVPSVVNLTEQAAQQKLRAKGFKPETETKATENRSADNIVLSSNPAGGESVQAGSTVTLQVGSFREPTTQAPTPPPPPPPQPPPPPPPATNPPPTDAPTTVAPTTTSSPPPTTTAPTTTNQP
ncbi:MAG: Stk1 family PASTA domain-containing Ser/Thr kinase [Candidatus Microthrix parvicella]